MYDRTGPTHYTSNTQYTRLKTSVIYTQNHIAGCCYSTSLQACEKRCVQIKPDC